jgi:signal transduction histidine kinase
MFRTALWTARAAAVLALVLRAAGGPGGLTGARHIGLHIAAGACLVGFLVWLLADLTSNRRVVPVALALLVTAIGALASSPSGELAPLAALAVMPSVASELRRVQSLACLAAGAIACEVPIALAPASRSQGQALAFVAALVGGHLIGRNRRAYRTTAEQSQALARSAELLREESQQNAVLGERSRIAREIHDVLAHTLGGVDVQVRAARALLASGEHARAASMLELVQRLTLDGLDEARRSVHALRTDTPPLARALEDLARAHAQRYDTTIDVSVPTEDGPRHQSAASDVPAQVTLAMLRVAQEALTNSAKHAPGRPVAIRLDAACGLSLSITNRLDANRPREAASCDRYGLRGMQERLDMVGGTLTCGPDGDGSWHVMAQVPSVAQRVDA